MTSINDKVCRCGTYHDHANMAARLLTWFSEQENVCPASKVAVTKFASVLAATECSLAMGRERPDRGIIGALEDHQRILSLCDEVHARAASAEFADVASGYLDTVRMINAERGELGNTKAADDMLAGVVKKRKGR